MIKVKSLKKNFYTNGKVIPVLKDINVEINTGEIVALCGPSGVGKSTLLHLLGLMEEPTSGVIELFGTDTSVLDANSKADFRKQHIGFLFQFHYLLAEFTVHENLLIPVRIKNSTADPRDKIKDLLKKLGLEDFAGRYPNELSGGEQQRVALARAVINRPGVILADEPTGNLDKENSEIVANLLIDEAKNCNSNLIIATHNTELAKKTDRIIYLRDGKVT